MQNPLKYIFFAFIDILQLTFRKDKFYFTFKHLITSANVVYFLLPYCFYNHLSLEKIFLQNMSSGYMAKENIHAPSAPLGSHILNIICINMILYNSLEIISHILKRVSERMKT